MPKRNILYCNLRAEMARRNINIQDIADTLQIDRSTASAKLSGKRQFSVKEAFELSKQLFDGLSLEYLFALPQGQIVM